MEVRWIRIVTDIFDDEKIILIEALPDADSIIVIWFKLLCLAGKQNNSGVLMLNERIAYTDEMLATVFRRPIQTVRLALKTFEQFGMVEIINGAITIPNWGKHQNIDGIEKVREQTRERVRNYRERQKLLTAGNVTENATVTDGNGTEKNREDKKRTDKRFVPPTLEEVIAYGKERNSSVDAKAFFDYYEAGEWKDGQGKPVKSWKQKFLTWERHETGNSVDKMQCKTSRSLDKNELEALERLKRLDHI